MNQTLIHIKTNLKLAMLVEVEWRKNADDSLSKEYETAIAQKDVSRAIISMIPSTGKKPEKTTDEDIQSLLRKYISMEKERLLYEQHHILQSDVEGKTASQVKKIVNDKIQELGDSLTSIKIEIADKYLPKQASEEEIIAFIETIDMSQFKNKMQAMGLIMKQFPGLDGNVAKRILINCN